MKIAIVDDLADDRSWLAQHIQKYMHNRGFQYTLFEYESGEAFLSSDEAFDIVFMDIYMGGMTGMETALALRQRDRDCKIIFLTTTEHYLRRGYSVGASHYLVKPAEEAEFIQAMDNCRIKPQYAVPFIDVTVGGGLLTIDTTKILYIDMVDRVVTIHTKEENLTIPGTFAAITEPLLADKRFLLCIKGVLVNMDGITRNESSVFILKNGERLQIALRDKKSILQTYHEYSFGKMGGAV